MARSESTNLSSTSAFSSFGLSVRAPSVCAAVLTASSVCLTSGLSGYADADGTLEVIGPVFMYSFEPAGLRWGEDFRGTEPSFGNFWPSGDDKVTYSLGEGAPEWLSVDSQTGALSGTPNGNAFEYTVTVNAQIVHNGHTIAARPAQEFFRVQLPGIYYPLHNTGTVGTAFPDGVLDGGIRAADPPQRGLLQAASWLEHGHRHRPHQRRAERTGLRMLGRGGLGRHEGRHALRGFRAARDHYHRALIQWGWPSDTNATGSGSTRSAQATPAISSTMPAMVVGEGP